jgi:hypothetical protein
MTIQWMGLTFETQADLDHARAHLSTHLNAITESERAAFVDAAMDKAIKDHAAALDELGNR